MKSPACLVQLSVLFIGASTVFSTTCANAVPPPPPRAIVRIATGLPGMTFKDLGEALAAAYRRVLPDVDFAVVETDGSVSNLTALQSHTADLGLALADVAYMGYNGHISEVQTATRTLRGIAVLHPSTVHILVSRDSRITSMSELRGRRVGVGPAGSGTAVTSAILLRAFGVQPNEVRLQTLQFLDATDALMRGELDAVFIAAADPVSAVRRATQAGARLLNISGPVVEQLRVEYPFLRPATIPPGTYPDQKEAIHTVQVDVLLMCREDLDDVLVHRLTKALFDILPQLTSIQSYLKLMDVRRAAATPIPLHPGAAWYYREQELSR
jgi:TRAP transporter TAXI family solute receptor